MPSTYIHDIPVRAEFKVAQKQNLPSINITFRANSDNIVLSRPGLDADIAIHRNQIEQLIVILTDCEHLFDLSDEINKTEDEE